MKIYIDRKCYLMLARLCRVVLTVHVDYLQGPPGQGPPLVRVLQKKTRSSE